MDSENKEILKEALQRVVDGDLSKVEYRICGICSYLQYYLYSKYPKEYVCTYKFVGSTSVGWKHHTGRKAFPVPHQIGLGDWEGKNLEMRQDLCKYLLEQLEAM